VKSPGATLYFSKEWNQPTSVTLTTGYGIQKTFNCHWEHKLNHLYGDTNLLMLDFPAGDTDSVQTMTWSDLHSGDEPYLFTPYILGYPVAYVPFNAGDTDTVSYKYHTFAMEWLPNEVRYLVDSVVVMRWPDRLVPPGNQYYDWVARMWRAPIEIQPAQFDMPGGGDPFGIDSSDNTQMYQARKYFEHAAAQSSWPGFETIDGKRVAHHMLDYVKVWDVPANVKIPDFPH
jgi:hypothetical protein